VRDCISSKLLNSLAANAAVRPAGAIFIGCSRDRDGLPPACQTEPPCPALVRRFLPAACHDVVGRPRDLPSAHLLRLFHAPTIAATFAQVVGCGRLRILCVLAQLGGGILRLLQCNCLLQVCVFKFQFPISVSVNFGRDRLYVHHSGCSFRRCVNL
jgi:hypothetical protein